MTTPRYLRALVWITASLGVVWSVASGFAATALVSAALAISCVVALEASRYQAKRRQMKA